MFPILSALLLLTAPAPIQITGGGFDTVFKFNGEAASEGLGSSVSDAGDVNGDGIPDVIVGAPGTHSGGPYPSGTAFVYSGLDGTVIHRFDGQGGRFPMVSGAGDVNADGFDDVILGAPWAESGGLTWAGVVSVYSGIDGSLLHQWNGDVRGAQLGWSVSGVGDLNGDGFDDVISGAKGAAPSGMLNAGSAYVYSGLDGSVLYQWNGTAQGDLLGGSVSGAGDVNGDGIPDVLVGAESADLPGIPDTGTALVYSGLDGAMIHQWYGEASGVEFGRCLSGAGDVDGDGFMDLIIGAPSTMSSSGPSGSSFVYSGFDGSEIYQLFGADGFVVSDAGDVNGDGFADLFAASNHGVGGSWSSISTALIYSGLDGSLMKEWIHDFEGDWYGISISTAGDIDGDGRDEVIVGTSAANPSGKAGAGSAGVYYLNPYLTASNTDISISTGTQVDLQLTFPKAAASYEYKVLLSVSGPGQMVRGVTIPLTSDFMVQRTLRGVYPFATYTDLHGTLNAQGHATASISIAPSELSPWLFGRWIYMAAVASADGFTPAEYSSMAVLIKITQ